MNWENMKKGLCPKCSEILEKRGGSIICPDTTDCSFTIIEWKYLDLIKDKKDSQLYQKAAKRYKGIKKYYARKRERLKTAFDLQREEIESNRRRMEARKL